MTCTICGQAEPQPGTGTMTLERADATFVMKGVPALVCPNCREEYVSPEVSARVLEFAEQAFRRDNSNFVSHFVHYTDGPSAHRIDGYNRC